MAESFSFLKDHKVESSNAFLPYVVFYFSFILRMSETFVSELRGHLGVMGGAGAFPAVCLSALLASFVVPLRLCAQADLSSPQDMPCFINSHL